MIAALRPPLLGAICLTILVLAWLFAAVAQKKRIAFWYPPAIVSEAVLMTYQVHIPLYPENHYAVLAAFDGEFRVQYTQIGLEGETRRTLWDNAKWQLPAGKIVIVAVLYGTRAGGSVGELARESRQVTVVARY